MFLNFEEYFFKRILGSKLKVLKFYKLRDSTIWDCEKKSFTFLENLP